MIAGRAMTALGMDPIHVRRKSFMDLMVIVQRNPQLAEVVQALRSPRRLAGGLNGRQQERYQDADDRNHDQQLDEGETM